MDLSRQIPCLLLGLILLIFAAQGLYHTIRDYITALSRDTPELERIVHHPIFLVQIGLFTLVILGAYLVPKLPPHDHKCKGTRRGIDWSSVRMESGRNFVVRQSRRFKE